jgi:hypothetical protein
MHFSKRRSHLQPGYPLVGNAWRSGLVMAVIQLAGGSSLPAADPLATARSLADSKYKG